MAESFEIRVQGRFSAVHQLRLPDGGMEPLHGHDWRVQAMFRGGELDRDDLLIDFELAARALDDVLADFNHGNLNTIPGLTGRNASTELVARLIYNRLRTRLGPNTPLAAVQVEEAPGCIVVYTRGDS
jgi:6-pyruvoyltetrahydropterin/6-carboxytetrahydropterin synthase